MRTADVEQKRDIGRGLAMAVVACLARDGEVAREIADVIKQNADQDVIDAYLAASDDGTSPSQPTKADGDEGKSLNNVLSVGPDRKFDILPLAGSRLTDTSTPR